MKDGRLSYVWFYNRLTLLIDELLSKPQHQDHSDRLLNVMLAERKKHQHQFIWYVEETLGTGSGQIKVTVGLDKQGGARAWRERARELKNDIE